MRTLTLQVQDNFVPSLLNILKEFKNEVTIKKDENLEYDPYFYERQRELKQIIKECENGTMELLSQEQYDDEMKIFFKDLKANADIQN
jgi:5,10-methylenetetrahydrofolate reductase